MNYITLFLAIVACSLQIRGHYVYNNEGDHNPNPTSWTIWGLTGLLEAWNYQDLSGDWVKDLLPWTCAVCCVVTWLVCVVKAKFRFNRLKVEDFASAALCITALLVWKVYGQVAGGNVIFQVDNLISFMPIILGVSRNPKEEKPAAWMWWTASYAVAALVVVIRFEKIEDLYFPVSCVLLHVLVGLLSLRTSGPARPNALDRIVLSTR